MSMQATAAPPRRALTPALLAIVLGFELFAVLFIALALVGSRLVPLSMAVTVSVVLLMLNVFALATVRKPWGLWSSALFQIAVLASGIVQPAIVIVGIVFIGLWALALWRGRRVDHRVEATTRKEEDLNGDN